MPYRIVKLKRGYKVVGRNGVVKARRTTKARAQRQVRLLNAITRRERK